MMIVDDGKQIGVRLRKDGPITTIWHKRYSPFGVILYAKATVNSSGRRGYEMRKIVGLAAIAAFAGTAALWSTATFVKSKATADLQATQASASVSAHEITLVHGKSLPVEYFAHPF